MCPFPDPSPWSRHSKPWLSMTTATRRPSSCFWSAPPSISVCRISSTISCQTYWPGDFRRQRETRACLRVTWWDGQEGAFVLLSKKKSVCAQWQLWSRLCLNPSRRHGSPFISVSLLSKSRKSFWVQGCFYIIWPTYNADAQHCHFPSSNTRDTSGQIFFFSV